jgi:hypothetical protein
MLDRHLRLASCLAIFVVVGCSSSTNPVKGDLSADAGKDAAVGDISGDMSRDLRLDSPFDVLIVPEALADFPQSDAARTSEALLYVRTADRDNFGLFSVPADGSSAATPVNGFGGLIDFDAISLSGAQPSLAIDSRRPRVTDDGDFSGVRLPAGGSLYYFHRTLTASSGIALVSGTNVQVLFESPGLYKTTVSMPIALSDDGVIGAAVIGDGELVLFRSSGSFAGGASFVKLAPPSGVVQLEPRSLTIVAGWLYVVGANQSGDEQLLRTSLDGTGSLAAVALAGTPKSVQSDLLVDDSGTQVLLRAGSSSAKLKLLLHDVSAGSARALTTQQEDIVARGDLFGSNQGQLALSPTGMRVAYLLRDANGKLSLRVRRVSDGDEKNLGAKTYFEQDAAVSIVNLVFTDDDNLLFMAGVTASQLDLYRYDAANDVLQNLSKTGSAQAPFDGRGLLASRAFLLDRPSGYLAWLAYDGSVGELDLLRVDLKTFRPNWLTKGRRISDSSADIAFCAQQKRLFFSARRDPQKFQYELWSVDLASNTQAKLLTALSANGPHLLTELHLTHDCSQLFFTAGPGFHQRRVWAVDLAASALRLVTPVPRFFAKPMWLSADGSTLVYASGGSPDAMTLKSVLTIGSQPQTIDGQGGAVHLLDGF